MRHGLIDKIFVLSVFAVISSVILNNVTLTGYSISLPRLEDQEVPAYNDVYFVDLGSYLNYHADNIDEGSKIFFKKDENTYSAVILRVVQDLDRGTESVSIQVSPGNKNIRLTEGKSALVDFNNDNNVDIKITVVSISNSKVNLVLTEY